MMRTLMIVTPAFGSIALILVLGLWYDRYMTRRGRRRT